MGRFAVEDRTFSSRTHSEKLENKALENLQTFLGLTHKTNCYKTGYNLGHKSLGYQKNTPSEMALFIILDDPLVPLISVDRLLRVWVV